MIAIEKHANVERDGVLSPYAALCGETVRGQSDAGWISFVPPISEA